MRPRADPHRDSKPSGAKPSGKGLLKSHPANVNAIDRVFASACEMPETTRIPDIMITLPGEPPLMPAAFATKQVKMLGADLVKSRLKSNVTSPPPESNVLIAGPFLLANIPEDKMVPPDREVFMFKTRIKDQWAHALADTGASENFMSQDLANFLNLEMHARKRPLRLLLANGDHVECTHFVRATVNIGTFSARMAFAVTQTGIPLVLGMPFHYRFEPIPRWRARKFVIYFEGRVHVLNAEPLQRLLKSDLANPVNFANVLRTNLPPMPVTAPPRSPLITPKFCSIAEDKITYTEISAEDKRAIQNLFHEDAMRTFHGKSIPKPSSPATDANPLPQPLKILLEQFRDVFPDQLPYGLPKQRETDHTIDLEPHAKPPAHRLYRLSPAEDEELRKQLTAYLLAGQIEPARSPFGAGVLFARKKDGSFRLCIDYRALNKITQKDKYPLPRIDELLDNMSGAQWFSKIDLQQGYHQIRVKKEHVPRTAFQTRYGSFQFKVLPFGLCNAPATFQRTMNNLLAPCREFAEVYIDDIIIHSRTLEEHVQHVREVLTLLRHEKLYAKMKKCAFGLREVEFCGFLVTAEGIRSHPDKLKSIREWPMPQNVADARAFFGLAGFYQRFVKNFANIAHPISSLFKKTAKWSWQDEQKRAFANLKDALMESTTLSYPDLNKEFVLHVDASADALGATLSQENHAGHLRLITCTSRKFNPAERNYPTHEREMLALVHALKKWKHYLLGARVKAFTDNVALKYWQTAQNLSPRQIRWLAYIAMFDIEIAHLPGKENTAADALSRLACPMVATRDVDWTDNYKADPKIANIYYDEKGTLLLPNAFRQGRIWDADRIVVPRDKIREVIAQCHNSIVSGHWGPRKTYDLVARKYSFPHAKTFVTEFCRACPTCQHVKADRRGEQGLFRPLQLPTRKWQSICMDWVVGLPEVTRNGRVYNAILTVTDRATRMCHLIPTVKSENAQETAQLLLQNVVRLHGLPRSIISDRDSRLTGEWWQELCRLLDTRHYPSTAYHPQTNGLAERTNQTMKQLLRTATFQGSSWFDVLPHAEMAMNNAPILNTDFSAYYLNYGYHPCLEADLFSFHAPQHDQVEPVDEFLSRIHTDWTHAYNLMLDQQDDLRMRENAHRHHATLLPGDQVLVNLRKHETASLHPRGPLAPHFTGPFKVLRAISENAFQIELPEKLKRAKVHDVFNVNHLKLYSTATPKLDKFSNSHAEFENIAPDNPTLVRDEPDDPERRPPPTAEIREILGEVGGTPPAQSPSSDPLPVDRQARDRHSPRHDHDIPISERSDVRRELFKNYLIFTETALMQAHDRDAARNMQISNSMPSPYAQPKEDVMLDPVVFREACKRLKFKPTIDLFANAQHHQCPRYCSAKFDPKALTQNAFTLNWASEWRPYANPPWSVIGRVLAKVVKERVTVMSVIPDWPHAPWYPQWKKLCVRDVLYTVPIFLDAHSRLRPKPRWNTRIGILDGNRA